MPLISIPQFHHNRKREKLWPMRGKIFAGYHNTHPLTALSLQTPPRTHKGYRIFWRKKPLEYSFPFRSFIQLLATLVKPDWKSIQNVWYLRTWRFLPYSCVHKKKFLFLRIMFMITYLYRYIPGIRYKTFLIQK